VFSNHIVDLLVAPRACCNHQGVRRRRCATSRAWRSPRSACSARHEKGRNVGRRVVENQRQQQGQRQRQRQVQRQPAASGPGATAVPVHGHRTRPPVTGSDTDEAISGNQERPWASFCGAPACRRGRRAKRHRSRGPQAPHVTDSPLQVSPGAQESRAPRSTRGRATAGVPSLRMCRCSSELVRAHSQGGHPRESRIGEARHCHQEGRRDARRWPQPTEDHKRPTPPQGGEPERRRDQRRT
jgi:hypothetical protein